MGIVVFTYAAFRLRKQQLLSKQIVNKANFSALLEPFFKKKKGQCLGRTTFSVFPPREGFLCAKVSADYLSLTERSAVAKSMKVSSDSSPASRTETDFSPLSSSEIVKNEED